MLLAGRYRLLDVLGDGGMARVYRARDERLDRIVAVKIMHPHYLSQPEFVRRFEQEAHLVAGVSHPNIVAIYDVDREGDTYLMVMEYVEGGSLKALMSRSAPLPLPRIAAIMKQLGLALDAAHARGVIHRDIKPENILLTPSGEVKVSDFGIARALTSPGQTATGMVLGSVSYFSPEQAQGKPATAESDLYSSGIVLYELLTGRLPFSAGNPLATAMQHVTQQPVPPCSLVPTLPPAIDNVVLTALNKDPALRYRSGAELATAFADAIAPGASAAVPPNAPNGRAGARAAAAANANATGRTVIAPRPAPRPMAQPQPTRPTAAQPRGGRPMAAAAAAPPRRRGTVAIPVLLALLLGGGVAYAATTRHHWGIGGFISGLFASGAPASSTPTATLPPAATTPAPVVTTASGGTGTPLVVGPSGAPTATTTAGAGNPATATPQLVLPSPSASVTGQSTATAPQGSATGVVGATATGTGSTTGATETAAAGILTPSVTGAAATATGMATDTVQPSPSSAPTHTPAPAVVNGPSADLTTSGSYPRDAYSNPIPVDPSDTLNADVGTIYVVVSFHRLPSGARTAVRWTYPPGTSPPTLYSFDQPYAVAFASTEIVPGPGRYTVTALVNGHAVGSHHFTVVAASGASSSGANNPGQGNGNGQGNSKGTNKRGDQGNVKGTSKHDNQGNDNGNSGDSEAGVATRLVMPV